MSEPKTIRTKSPDDIRAQRNRIQMELFARNDFGSPQSAARYQRVERAFQGYLQNMRNSSTMARAMQEAGANTQAERDAFMGSFGRYNEIQIPVTQYRRNNR